jgi:hypothetical protein
MIDLDFQPIATGMRPIRGTVLWALVDTFGNTVDVTDEAGKRAILEDEARMAQAAGW